MLPSHCHVPRTGAAERRHVDTIRHEEHLEGHTSLEGKGDELQESAAGGVALATHCAPRGVGCCERCGAQCRPLWRGSERELGQRLYYDVQHSFLRRAVRTL